MSPEELVRRVEGVLRGVEGPRRGDGVVVALSGGIDSTVLLDVLYRLRGELDLRNTTSLGDRVFGGAV